MLEEWQRRNIPEEVDTLVAAVPFNSATRRRS